MTKFDEHLERKSSPDIKFWSKLTQFFVEFWYSKDPVRRSLRSMPLLVLLLLIFCPFCTFYYVLLMLLAKLIERAITSSLILTPSLCFAYFSLMKLAQQLAKIRTQLVWNFLLSAKALWMKRWLKNSNPSCWVLFADGRKIPMLGSKIVTRSALLVLVNRANFCACWSEHVWILEKVPQCFTV